MNEHTKTLELVTHFKNPDHQEVEIKGSELQSHPQMHRKFEASLGCMSPYLNHHHHHHSHHSHHHYHHHHHKYQQQQQQPQYLTNKSHLSLTGWRYSLYLGDFCFVSLLIKFQLNSKLKPYFLFHAPCVPSCEGWRFQIPDLLQVVAKVNILKLGKLGNDVFESTFAKVERTLCNDPLGREIVASNGSSPGY